VLMCPYGLRPGRVPPLDPPFYATETGVLIMRDGSKK